MQQIPSRNEKFIWRNLEGELVLLNPHSGQYFGLNAVGCSFYEKIDGSRTVGEIIDLLLEKFEVDRSTLENDLAELIKTMVAKEIIVIK
jgi:hypothetical protein